MTTIIRTARATPVVAYIETRDRPGVRQYLTPWGPVEVAKPAPFAGRPALPSGLTLYKGERGARAGIRHALAKALRERGAEWSAYGWHAPAGGVL